MISKHILTFTRETMVKVKDIYHSTLVCLQRNYIDKSMREGKGLHVNRADKVVVQSHVNIDIDHGDEVDEYV
jgi:hypothetical protein